MRVPRNAQAGQFLGSFAAAPAMKMKFEESAGKLTRFVTCSGLEGLIWSCFEALRAVLVEANHHQACPNGVLFTQLYLSKYLVNLSDFCCHG